MGSGSGAGSGRHGGQAVKATSSICSSSRQSALAATVTDTHAGLSAFYLLLLYRYLLLKRRPEGRPVTIFIPSSLFPLI